MQLVGREYYADDAYNIVAGDDEYHDWDEDWTFVRDMSTDGRVADRTHALLRVEQGGWDFAHHGWTVASIARLGNPVTPG